MQKQYKGFLKPLYVHLVITCLAIFAWSSLTYAQIPQGWESYYDRPDILSVSARPLENDPSWEVLKAAHFSFVAELLAFYPPDVDLYFLARDSEHLYDVARLATQNTKAANRIHLLNVSRANMYAGNLKDYLAENGISKESLAAGKKVVLIDTGFEGSISYSIQKLFSDDLRKSIKTHLIISKNQNHPSSRAFLIHINPAANSTAPTNLHSSILTYEHMPRYTDRSSQYVYFDGRYHPASPIVTESGKDGTVSKSQSLNYMMDLRAEWENPQTRKAFFAEYKRIRSLITALANPEKAEKVKQELARTATTPQGRLLEAQVRDIYEARVNGYVRPTVPSESLGIKLEYTNVELKAQDYVKKFPEWGPILENPEVKIPELIEAKNWQLIGNLIDADINSTINKFLIKGLFDAPATGIKKSLQVALIQSGNEEILRYLVTEIFSQPYAEQMPDLIRLVIERNMPEVLRYLAYSAFTRPHAKNMGDLLLLLVKKNHPDVNATVAQTVVKSSHAEVIEFLIRNGNQEIHKNLAQGVFSYPNTESIQHLMKLLLEKADPKTLIAFAEDVFSSPHTEKMGPLLKILIARGDSDLMNYLAVRVFSKPHTQRMEDLLLEVIRKGNASTIRYIAKDVFLKPHSKDMTKAFQLLLSKADPQTAESLKNSPAYREKVISAPAQPGSLRPSRSIQIRCEAVYAL